MCRCGTVLALFSDLSSKSAVSYPLLMQAVFSCIPVSVLEGSDFQTRSGKLNEQLRLVGFDMSVALSMVLGKWKSTRNLDQS